MAEVIRRAALGQKGKLGDLYDARVDKVLGVSLIKGLPSTFVNTEFNTSTSTNFILDDGYSAKFSLLQVPSNQQASFLVGLLDGNLNGSGKFLQNDDYDEDDDDDRTVRSVAKISVTTKTETLVTPIEREYLNNMLKFDKRLKSATHVISQIEWGAALILVFEYDNEEGEEKSKISTRLHSYVQNIITNPISADTDAEKSSLKNIKIKVFCDCEDEELENRLNSSPEHLAASQLSIQLLSLVQNQSGKMGKPMFYKLEPMHHFSQLLTPMLNTVKLTSSFIELPSSTVGKIVTIFDKLMEARKMLQGFNFQVDKMTSLSMPIKLPDKKVLDNAKDQVQKEYQEFVNDIKEALVSVRRDEHESNVDILENIFLKWETGANCSKNMQSFLNSTFEDDIKRIKFVQRLLKKNVQIVAQDKLDDVLKRQSSTEASTLVLFYKNPDNDTAEDFYRNRNLFLSYLEGIENSVEANANVLFKTNLKTEAREKFTTKLRLQDGSLLKLIQPNEFFEVTILGHISKQAESFNVEIASTHDLLLKYTNNFTEGNQTLSNSPDNIKTRKLQLKKNAFFQLKIIRDFDGFKIILDKERELKLQHIGEWYSPNLKILISGEAEIFILKVDVPFPPSTKNQIQELPFINKDFLKFIMVDSDLVTENEYSEGKNDTTIHVYKNDKSVTTDLCTTSTSYSGKKTAKSIKPLISIYQGVMPSKIAHVKIRCPGSFIGKCEPNQEMWLCWKCEQRLEYRYDSHFYCPCGKGDITDFRFQCKGEFLEFSNKDNLYSQLKSLKQFTEKNILLLGSTGVGKSTWINSVANYLTYKTIDEAAKHEIVALIPSKFTLTDDDFEEVEIAVGQDSNEVLQAGQSATQHPTSYTFKTEDEFVRIIDTPGIGDTRGVEQDKLNFQFIMKHLSHIDMLHGICILIKPNQARLDIAFEFCLKELLTHLHRDAAQNLVFCFTNSRSTFYRPGDTMAPLKSLLEGDPLMESLINLSKNTVYCMDNEAFRFLAAVKCGQNFGEDEKQNFSASWGKSVTETRRLLHFLDSLTPHNTKSTVTLNNTRQIILKLSQPIAEIDQEILSEDAVIKDRQNDLTIENQKCADLRAGKTSLTQSDVDIVKTGTRNTVCESLKCKETIMLGSNNVKTHYKTICHRNCTCAPDAPLNQLQCAQLQKCSYMTVVNRRYQCSQCGCPNENHMHIDYETQKKTVQVATNNSATQLTTAETQVKEIEKIIKDGQDKIAGYKQERNKITEVSAEFALFLQNNGISVYNDALLRYLEHQINIEEDKVCPDGKNQVLDNLKELRQIYTAEIDILKAALNSPTGGLGQGQNVASAETMQKLIKPLYELPLFGKKIENLIETTNKSKRYMYSKKSFLPNTSFK